MQTERPGLEIVTPRWPAPAHVRALCTTREGGVSSGVYRSLNLALHVGDEPAAVRRNRARLREALALPAAPCWLEQTHGTALIEAATYSSPPAADAVYSARHGQVCAIMTADCLPILLCDRQGSVVLALHAGWRGLLSNIVARALSAFDIPRTEWLAWIGPGISAAAYAVGEDLVEQFCARDPAYRTCFIRDAAGTRADLPGLAELQLRSAGLVQVSRYPGCTASEPQRFFSYRRDGVTGRFATLIWLA